MAGSRKLQVMISSRCETMFPQAGGRKLSDIRLELKDEIERMEIAGRKAFEVWINEDTPPKGGTWDSWDVCLQAAQDCHVLIVLSNGDAGWAANGGEVGICHAEMMTGLSMAPAKVRLIALPDVPITDDEAGHRNRRFQEEMKKQGLFRGGTVNDAETLKARVREALNDAVIALAQAGVADAARGKYSSGAALDWSRLDFRARQSEMVAVVKAALLARPAAEDSKGCVFVWLNGLRVLAQVHAIPAALTVGPAREMVGQPFLRDHELSDNLRDDVGGPLHVIACHKTATEPQAAKLLGFPDATIVSAPFGVFVADPVQKVQFAFITNCRDATNTRHGIQRFFEWLRQTNEEANVAERARSRAHIVRAVAHVQEPTATHSIASNSKRNAGATTLRRRK
ncbi:MAG: hypothetical protein IPK85_05570 [Gemmatimonadetes bacterium]|nr:hypothetical protein [Gemmatimonadota bacterium]